MNKVLKTNEEYQKWIEKISENYKKQQIKAAVLVNKEMLHFYWMLGKDIVDLKAESKWGTGFY